MPVVTDQIGRTITLSSAPQRIVSTVPSQTELLHALGLEAQVVGITAYCEHPAHWLRKKTVIGGTKNLQLEKIKALQPDLILAGKEENIKEQIETLAQEIPAWVSDVRDVSSALQMIQQVGALTAKETAAQELVAAIEAARPDPPETFIPAAFYIWKNPWMLAGSDTFINAMLREAGLQNVALAGAERYPTVTPQELASLKPRLVLLTSEPYNFNSGEAHEVGKLIPHARIKIVEGSYFTWYGSRMVKGMEYARKIRRETDLCL